MSIRNICAISAVLLFLPLCQANAETFQTIYSFTAGGNGPVEGWEPISGLVLDRSGIFYGSTEYGLSGHSGTIFTLNPATGVAATLHVFSGGSDGARPAAALTIDAQGLVYGTTDNGGAYGFGTVFELNPATRKLTTLHAFTGGADGANPLAKLAVDKSGALYGTASARGRESSGTIFKVDPKTKVFTTLHTFRGPDGAYPEGGLIFAGTQKVYGTTRYGGSDGSDGKGGNAGVLFELNLATKRLTVLHIFRLSTPEGYGPRGQLALDKKGIIYGAAQSGPEAPGYVNDGTIFRLDPASKMLRTLHRFGSSANDGKSPYGGVTIDPAGTLYGTTSGGGSSGYGTVFTLNTIVKEYKILYSFAEATGVQPQDGVVLNTSGALFGTTQQGGKPNFGGTVFKLTP